MQPYIIIDKCLRYDNIVGSRPAKRVGKPYKNIHLFIRRDIVEFHVRIYIRLNNNYFIRVFLLIVIPEDNQGKDYGDNKEKSEKAELRRSGF